MKNFFEKFKMRDKGTILRTIFLALALTNYILSIVSTTAFGVTPIYQWISFGVFVLMVIISYWYNNNWTGFASLAEDIFNMLSDGKITADELKEFIVKHKKDLMETKKKDKADDGVEHK